MFTHFKSLQFNQANNISIYHSSNSSHKMIKTNQSMQACKRLFYLKKWFLMVHKHLKTPNDHFIKWQNHLYNILLHKPFLDQVIILCGVEMLLIRQNSIGFTKYVFKPYNLVFRVREFISKTFHKGFLPKPFLIIKQYFYLSRNGLNTKFILLIHQIHF